MSARNKAYLSLSINAIVWGAALPIVKPALSVVSPYQFLFYRYAIAATLSLPVLILLIRKHKPSWKTIRTIASLELLSVMVALSFLYEGLKRTTSIESTLIANASPLFIILGGILFLKEKEERHELVGLILAMAGVTLLILEPLTSGRNQLGFSLAGNLLVLGYSLSWAAYLLLAKRLYRGVSKLLVGFLSLWVGLPAFFLLTLVTSPPSQGLVDQSLMHLAVPAVLLASVYMAFFGSVIGVPTYIYGNDQIEASEASLFHYLQPIVTIPLATLWLRESINVAMVVGMLLITLGVLTAELRTSRAKVRLHLSQVPSTIHPRK